MAAARSPPRSSSATPPAPNGSRPTRASPATPAPPPTPASSGNTKRHRLHRGGDRQLNRALHIIAPSRARTDPTTHLDPEAGARARLPPAEEKQLGRRARERCFAESALQAQTRSAPGRIRTFGLCLRRAALYPLSYGRGPGRV